MKHYKVWYGECVPDAELHEPDSWHAKLVKGRYDIISFDGGHSEQTTSADFKNMSKFAAPGHVLLLDDTPCSASFCEGPTKTLQSNVDNKNVRLLRQFHQGAGHGLSVLRYEQ